MANTGSMLRAGAIALGLLSLAACATKPAPAPSQAPTPAPAPVAQAAPAPSAPVTQAPMGPIPGSAQDFVVNVGDRVYFDTDQFSVRDDAKPILDGQAAWLSRYPAVHVRIEGNADERGTREYNFALGARRAEAVRSYMVARGVAPSRIETISYGKERPIDTGSGEDAWSKNRNGHTALTSGAN